MKFFTSLLAVILMLSFLPLISVSALVDATYTDESGISRDVIATVVTNYTTELTSGWYVAYGAVKTTNLKVVGSAKLILADGCVLTAVANSNNAGIELEHGNFLTIYGQVLDTGRLTASGNGKGSGIGGSGGTDSTSTAPGGIGGHCGDLTINGGNVITNRLGGGDGGRGGGSVSTVYSSDGYGGNGGNGGIIILRKGSLSVTGNLGGGNGGHSTYRQGGAGGNINSITVSGGILTAGSICGGTGGDGTFVFNGITGGITMPVAIGRAGSGGSGGTVNISGGRVIVTGNGFDTPGNIGGGRAGNTSALSTTPGIGGNGSAVTISGGTVKVSGIIGGGSNSPWVSSGRGGAGSCVITGGSVAVSLMLPVPANGSANGNKLLFKTPVTLEGAADNTVVLYVFSTPTYSYGTKAISTDSGGQITLWLPDGVFVSKVYTNDACYSGSVRSGTAGILPEAPPDTVKPAVSSVSPGKSAVNISVSGKIIVTFNEIMQTSSGSVSLTSGAAGGAGGGSSVVLTGGTWSLINSVYSVSYSGLTKGANYTITVSGFSDLAGNICNIDTSYSFSTILPVPMFDFSYIDEAGEVQTASSYKLDASYQTLTTGWYAAEGTLNLSNVTISGDVKLILTDGCNLIFGGTGANAAVRLKNGNTLTIFGQNLGTGTLTAAAPGRGAGIGGNGGTGSSYDSSKATGETCGTLKIYGGNVVADKIGGGDGDDLVGFSAGSGGSGGAVIIGGGSLSVSSRIGGGDGGDGTPGLYIGGNGGNGSSLIISGGNVTVTGRIGGGAAGAGSSYPFHLTAKPGSSGSCTITGGSVKVGSMQPVPKNGSAYGNLTLSLTTVTLAGASAGLRIKALVTNRPEMYGVRDMKTDAAGRIYIWLPSGAVVSEAYATGRYFGTVPSSSSGTLTLGSTDNNKPVILSSVPASDATDIQPGGNIVITFSKVMDTSKGRVGLSAEESDRADLSGGVWTYSGTVFTVPYQNLAYSTSFTAVIEGFQDISGNAADSSEFMFSTMMHPKTVIVGSQNGEPVSSVADSAAYLVSTISIDSGSFITLNNINGIEGISAETPETTGDTTVVTIRTTSATPAGSHPLTLTIDGATSETFRLVVAEGVHSISLSETDIYTFPNLEAGYASPDVYSVKVTNTGNLSTGILTVSLAGKDSSSFILSPEEIADIPVADTGSFGIRPADGLPEGTYSATVVISGTLITTVTFDVSFTVVKRSGNLVKTVSSPLGATVKGTSIFAVVENDVISLLLDFGVSDGASWKLYSDIACTDEITDKTMLLDEGANMAFAVVTAENGSTRLYAVSVLRMAGGLLGSPNTGDGDGVWVWLIFGTGAACVLLMRKRKIS